MKFVVVTLFPDMLEASLQEGVVGRAKKNGIVDVSYTNPRDFTKDVHRTVDDKPYGGGAGMVLKPGPVMAAIDNVVADCGPSGARRILLSAQGKKFTTSMAQDWAKRWQKDKRPVMLVCGRYEGIDGRVAELGIDEKICIGDFVLSGGELAASVVIDAVSRFIPGVLGDPASAQLESFSKGLLEHEHYTRPEVFRGLSVPKILLTGHHKNIEEWRDSQAKQITAATRPSLLHTYFRRHPEEMQSLCRRCFAVLVHYPVLDRQGDTVATSITNLDVHDLARLSHTYGLGGCFVVTPVSAQAEKLRHMTAVWTKDSRDHRVTALRKLTVAESFDAVMDTVQNEYPAKPFVVGTSAQASSDAVVSSQAVASISQNQPDRATILVFGTGWGLAPSIRANIDQFLQPITGCADTNHLSVRSAMAVILDRLFGLGETIEEE